MAGSTMYTPRVGHIHQHVVVKVAVCQDVSETYRSRVIFNTIRALFAEVAAFGCMLPTGYGFNHHPGQTNEVPKCPCISIDKLIFALPPLNCLMQSSGVFHDQSTLQSCGCPQGRKHRLSHAVTFAHAKKPNLILKADDFV